MTQPRKIEIDGVIYIEKTDDVRHRLAQDYRMCSVAVMPWNYQEAQLLMGYHINRGGWELGGGAIGPAESIVDAAKRELWEEAHVTGKDFQCLGWIERWPNWITFIYQCEVVEAPNPLEIPEPHTHREWGWFDRFPQQLTAPMRYVVTDVLKGEFRPEAGKQCH